MNYWHIQLHPNDRQNFPPEVIREILVQKLVIGLGEWEDGEATRNQFIDRMSIGDIVAIKEGSVPIALVKVIGDAYFERTIDNNFDWFPNRRPIEILEFYNPEHDFTIPQSRGTLSICDNLNTATSQVIINWHRRILRQSIMENMKLTPKRQEEIKTLWSNFKKEYSTSDLDILDKEINRFKEAWNVYKSKIEDDSFSLDNYTNRLDREAEQLPGGYLCNFLERETRKVFGSSKPGNANNFEIKLNSDSESYTIRKELKRGDKQNINTRERAKEEFESNIKPLIKSIVSETEVVEKVTKVETADYAAKQVLRKLAVLGSPGQFLFMYSDEAIDSLHSEFVDSEEETNLGKNHEIRVIANELLEISTSVVDSVLVSRFLWKYANTQGIADINTPNVILYGPPGTGKTYSVKNSLDFICQGDRSRYELVQFHPSFTYEDFIEGIKPKGVTKDGNIKFELVDGIFKRFCKKAKADPDNEYYFIVDEINRANLSAVFGETLLCLEKDYRHNVNEDSHGQNLVKTQYSSLIEEMITDDKKNEKLAYHYQDGGAYFGVPSNLFFIGMMNDVDKSIDAFDLALRRRFKWIRKDCNYDVIEQETKYRNGDDFLNIETYVKACEKLNSFISQDLGLGKSYEFGHSFFMKVSDIASQKRISSNNLKTLFELHLKPTLNEYLRAMYPESELNKKIDEALTNFIKPLG